jgi:succinate dehydrogenase/fumarate reductase cytochrome b subunit
MKEKNLRKYHRITGVVLAVFIIVQAGTGLIFTIGKMTGNSGGHDHGTAGISMLPVSKALASSSSESSQSDTHESVLSTVHYGGGMIGNIYRLLLAVAIIGQVSGGLWIYIRIRKRKQANT